jgi:nitrogen fixation protein
MRFSGPQRDRLLRLDCDLREDPVIAAAQLDRLGGSVIAAANWRAPIRRTMMRPRVAVDP